MDALAASRGLQVSIEFARPLVLVILLSLEVLLSASRGVLVEAAGATERVLLARGRAGPAAAGLASSILMSMLVSMRVQWALVCTLVDAEAAFYDSSYAAGTDHWPLAADR